MTQPPIEPTEPEGVDAASDVVDGSAAESGATDGAAGVPVGVAADGSVLPAVATPPRGRFRGLAIGVVVAAVVVILGAGGFAAYAFLSGGGAQPEDVVSADALAFVKVDLDPAAGQKVALARLARSLNDGSDVSSVDDPKRGVADILSGLTGVSVDYDRDLKAWVGNRAAVAVLSGDGSSLEALARVTQPLVVIATDDEGAAQESLSRLFADDGKWSVATRDGFVLVGSPSATAVPDVTLASTNGYTGTEAAVGDSIVFAYLNVDRGLDLAESSADQIESLVALAGENETFIPGQPQLQPGQFTEGLAKTREWLNGIPNRLGTRTVGIGLVAKPDGFDITVKATGLSKALPSTAPLEVSKNAVAALQLQGYQNFLSSGLAGLPEEFQGEDAAAVVDAFGEQLTAQFGVDGDGTPVIRAVVSGDNPKLIEQAWQALASGTLIPAEIRNDGTQVVIGTPGASALFGDSEGNARVLATLPEADQAAIFGFVDIDALEASPLGADLDTALKDFSAFGVSVSGPQAGDLTVRFAIRWG